MRNFNLLALYHKLRPWLPTVLFANQAHKYITHALGSLLANNALLRFAVSLISMALAVIFFEILTTFAAKKMIPFISRVATSKALNRRDFPLRLRWLELLWPKQVREEVWQPAFDDELAAYSEIPKETNTRVLNLLFVARMLIWMVVTARIAWLDRRLLLLANKRSRLAKGYKRSTRKD